MLRSLFRHPAVRNGIKGILAAAVLVYLVYVVDVAAITEALQDARWALVGLAVALLPLNLALEAAVWRTIVRSVAPKTTWRSIFGALLCGFSLGLFTPARVGEFAGRAFYLPHSDGWETSVTVLAQRLLDMAVSVGAGSAVLATVLLTTDWLPSPAWWGLFAIGAGTAIALTIALLLPKRTASLLDSLISRQSILQRLRFLDKISRRAILSAYGMAALRYALYITQFAILAFAFAPGMPAVLVFSALALVYLAKFLAPSITLMDLGIREGFAVFFFGALGLSQAAAFNASLFIFLSNVTLPALIGLPFVFKMRLKTAEARKESVSAPATASKSST